MLGKVHKHHITHAYVSFLMVQLHQVTIFFFKVAAIFILLHTLAYKTQIFIIIFVFFLLLFSTQVCTWWPVSGVCRLPCSGA